MHNKGEGFFKHGKRPILADILRIKNNLISVVPDAPASNNHGFLKVYTVVPLLSINEHIYQCIIYIPFETKLPPKRLTKVTLEEEMDQVFV
jgi:hypothetical protein